ncbi:MAG: ROK family protein [Cytophagaceae bacterium]|jgi:glucokinase|nr:ROK family protein [Cytophagaceae bacterium]
MILGIDLGGTNIRIGQIVDGRIINIVKGPSPAGLSLDDSIAYLKLFIGKMVTDDVTGMGIGVPSVVDVERGIVYNATNMPSWKEVHLKDILTDEFKMPVCINNDANCFALGEKVYGAGKECRDMIGVTLGTGVGAGIIINNALYCGCNAGAGEIGSIPYLNATLEHYCSGDFFISRYNTTGRQVAAKAQLGDSWALNIWDEFGGHVGHLMEAVLYTYDPEMIVLGGGIARSYQFFERKMMATLKKFPYPQTVKNIRIEISMNGDIGILGAGALHLL